MNAWAETLLDKLERIATKAHPTKTLYQRWLARVSPDSALQPTDTYSWLLFFRVAALALAVLVPYLILSTALFWGTIWYYRPELFNNPKYHKMLIGLLSREGVYWTPLALVFLVLFNHALYLPRRYFWNRRAARLRREPPEPETVPIGSVWADPGVWPPPPNRN